VVQTISGAKVIQFLRPTDEYDGHFFKRSQSSTEMFQLCLLLPFSSSSNTRSCIFTVQSN